MYKFEITIHLTLMNNHNNNIIRILNFYMLAQQLNSRGDRRRLRIS